MLCDTMTTVSPPACSWAMRSRNSSRATGSSPATGSSSTRMRGSMASTPANATRRCWPPDSSKALVAQLDDVEAHAFQSGFHAAINFVGGKPQVAGTERHVLAHGGGEQLVLGILEHEPHLAAAGLRRALVGQILPVQQHAPARGMHEAVHVLDEGALAASRMPGDAEELAVVQRERDVAQRPDGVGVGAPGGFSVFKRRGIFDHARLAAALHARLPLLLAGGVGVRVAYAFESNRHSSSFNVVVSMCMPTGTPRRCSSSDSSAANGRSRFSRSSSSACTSTS